MQKKHPPQLSGKQFVDLIQSEIGKRNTNITHVSLARLSRASGLSEGYLRKLVLRKEPNPSVLVMRAVLFTLGFDVEQADQDVIPMLKRKGVYDEAIHELPSNKTERGVA